jgi:hypothetical protein
VILRDDPSLAAAAAVDCHHFGGVSSVVSVKVDSVSDTTERSIFDGEPDGVGVSALPGSALCHETSSMQ